MAYQKGDFPYNVFGNCKDYLRKMGLGEPWHSFLDCSLEDGKEKKLKQFCEI